MPARSTSLGGSSSPAGEKKADSSTSFNSLLAATVSLLRRASRMSWTPALQRPSPPTLEGSKFTLGSLGILRRRKNAEGTEGRKVK